MSRPEEGEKKEKETKQFELGLFEFESRIIRKDNFSIEKKKERERKRKMDWNPDKMSVFTGLTIQKDTRQRGRERGEYRL